MARKNKHSQINQVRKVNSTPDLSGSTKLPEDEVKGTHTKHHKIDSKHGRKPKSTLDVNPHKTRTKKATTKSSYDRHAPRKSDIEKQYTKEYQKLRNRLRYREKQGYTVNWGTLPTRPKKITQASINKLKQFRTRQNAFGEIELYRTYDKNARNFRLKPQNTNKVKTRNEEGFTPPEESTQHFDIFDRVREALLKDIEIVSDNGVDPDHPLQDDRWIELTYGVQLAYYQALELFETNVEAWGKTYAEYLLKNEAIIIDAIDVVLYVSTDEGLAEAKSELLRYLDIH